MIVIDASAVVDALTVAPGTEALREFLAAHELHAPALLDFEVVAALRGLTLAGHISAARARESLTDYDALPIQRWLAEAPLRLRAYALRDNLSAYDAAYVALAEALGCPLVTRDMRLARSASHAAAVRAF